MKNRGKLRIKNAQEELKCDHKTYFYPQGGERE